MMRPEYNFKPEEFGQALKVSEKYLRSMIEEMQKAVHDGEQPEAIMKNCMEIVTERIATFPARDGNAEITFVVAMLAHAAHLLAAIRCRVHTNN
jgi:hypothetical protein